MLLDSLLQGYFKDHINILFVQFLRDSYYLYTLREIIKQLLQGS